MHLKGAMAGSLLGEHQEIGGFPNELPPSRGRVRRCARHRAAAESQTHEVSTLGELLSGERQTLTSCSH